MTYLARRIFDLRTQRSLKQDELAEALGVSRQAVSKWEMGTGTPTLENLVAISSFFGVSLDSLVKDPSPAEAEIPPQPEYRYKISRKKRNPIADENAHQRGDTRCGVPVFAYRGERDSSLHRSAYEPLLARGACELSESSALYVCGHKPYFQRAALLFYDGGFPRRRVYPLSRARIQKPPARRYRAVACFGRKPCGLVPSPKLCGFKRILPCRTVFELRGIPCFLSDTHARERL